jgi:hypothetical protein
VRYSYTIKASVSSKRVHDKAKSKVNIKPLKAKITIEFKVNKKIDQTTTKSGVKRYT